MQSTILQNLIALPFNDFGKDELVRKYKNCILFVRKSKEDVPTLATFLGLRDNFMLFKDKNDFNFQVSLSGNCDVFYKFPKTGLFQTETGFLLAQRVPCRQFRRAPCVDNVKIISPLTALLGGYIQNNTFCIEHLEKSYNPVYYSLEQADELLCTSEKLCSVALSSLFGLSLHPYEDSLRVLWYLSTPIATIDNKEKTIYVKVEVFSQEISDFIRRERLVEWKIK